MPTYAAAKIGRLCCRLDLLFEHRGLAQREFTRFPFAGENPIALATKFRCAFPVEQDFR
jgi:hypothetical protein